MKNVLFILLAVPALGLGAPIITTISAFTTHELFRFEAFYESQPLSFDPWTPGGWCFQLFMDADQDNSTGYSGEGFDFMARGIERESNGSIHVRETMGSCGPGGWGASVGTVPFVLEDGFFTFDVPLSFLKGATPELDFRLEMYETVASPENPMGIAHQYAGHYDGTTPYAGVPEPSMIHLLASGILYSWVIAFLRRKRRADCAA